MVLLIANIQCFLFHNIEYFDYERKRKKEVVSGLVIEVWHDISMPFEKSIILRPKFF